MNTLIIDKQIIFIFNIISPALSCFILLPCFQIKHIMNTFEFKSSWADIIKKYAAESESSGQLHPEILDLIYSQNWFNIYVPKIYGGLEKPLPEILQLEEALAKTDGSTAWTVTLCSGAAWFAGFLDAELAQEIFSNPKACLAGSGANTGTAVKTKNGYIINGSWKYASGALHATHFTMNCIVKETDGSPVLNDSNEELILSLVLDKKDITIVKNWPSIGMVASGSHSFEVNNIKVAANRSFAINESLITGYKHLNYPFLQLAEATLAVNFLGMGLHFTELVEDYFFRRSGIERYTKEQKAYFEKEFINQKEMLLNVKKDFYTAVNTSWTQFMNNDVIEDAVLLEVTQQSRQVAHISRKVVDSLYIYCGLEAAKYSSELNRVWRDIHTASQHSLMTFEF